MTKRQSIISVLSWPNTDDEPAAASGADPPSFMADAMENGALPTVTARKVAQFVYWKHSWWLSRQNAAVTDEARQRMNAGVAWQDQKDQQVTAAIEHQARSKSVSTLAWLALIVFLALVAIWESYSLLRG